MPYENLGGVRAVYNDGSFRQIRTSNQPRILVLGTATSGLTGEILPITNVNEAEVRYGASSEIMKGVHECLAQGADNVATMRIGGKKGEFSFTDPASGELVITPSAADDEILARYNIIMSNDGSVNRLLLWDNVSENFVYDSEEVLAISSDVIEVSGLEDLNGLYQIGDVNDPAAAISLADVVVGDWDTSGSNVQPDAITLTAGSDGTDVSLAEMYSALNSAYFSLDYKDASFLLPVGVHIDEANIADQVAANRSSNPSGATNDVGRYGLFWKGCPVKDSEQDLLGYTWEYKYEGQIFSYQVDCSNYFSDLANAANASRTVNTTLIVSAAKDGKGGNAVTIQINAAGAAGPTATITETEFGFDILVEDDGTGTTAEAATAINDALEAFTLSSGVLASTLVTASGGVTTLVTVAKTNLTGGRGGAFLSPEDMQRMTIPTAVSDRFDAGADGELRECNFAHQLGTFARLASVSWQDCMGAISFKEPDGYGRTQIASHFGTKPTLLDNGREEYIDAPADNGSGVLGYKYLAGFSASTGGYRSSRVTNGGANDSLAYGGLILTKGASLPNGTKWPYGISDGDEAVDSRGAPIDLGAHLFIPADWVIHRNGYNGGSVYRSTICGTLLGKLATLPPEVEPIGENGRVAGIQLGRRVHSTQLDSLAALRIPMLRVEEGGTNLTFTTAKTAAHPDSDYSRVSTIRSVNRHLQDLRSICRPFIGKPFSSRVLSTIQAQIDQYCTQARVNGWNQGAVGRVTYTPSQKILGRLSVQLRMVPPFSIDTITVETSVTSDESEL